MIRVDTNYIIRYLINDDIEMANIAEIILTSKKVFISNEILAEVVYVLSRVYKIPTFKIFKTKNLDFVDCLLCAYSKEDEIVTFDKKLNKCISNNN